MQSDLLQTKQFDHCHKLMILSLLIFLADQNSRRRGKTRQIANFTNTPLHFDEKKTWVVIIHLQETEGNVDEKKTKIVVDTVRGQLKNPGREKDPGHLATAMLTGDRDQNRQLTWTSLPGTVYILGQ